MRNPLTDKTKSRKHVNVALRAVAVIAAHRAFPTMPFGQLGAALGMNRHTVRHYILGDIKALQIAPDWAPLLWKACDQVANTSQPGRAALTFEQLARELHRIANAENLTNEKTA